MGFDKNTFRTKVRRYMKDYIERNRLLAGEYESEDPDIDLAIELALGELNMVPPIDPTMIYTEDSVTEIGATYLLMDGVVSKLIMSEAFVQFRNELEYSDGGETVRSSNKGDPYSRLSQMLLQSFLAKCSAIKKANNYVAAWGGTASPYARAVYASNNLGGL